MSEEEIRALKELEYDLKEHKTKYAKNYEDVCYNSLIKLQQENIQLKQQLEQLEEKYINNVPCCNEEDCELFKNYMLLQQQLKDKDEKISKVKEYITSYESISIIQNLENAKENIKLDEKTTIEMCRRYLIVHDKILEILESNKED